MHRISSIAAALVAALLLAAPPAPAQDADRYETVTNRARPGLDPEGMRAGSFRVFPALSLTYIDDDNVFATTTGEVSDNILIVRPELRARSDWGRHAVNAGAVLTSADYDDNPGEDYDDLELWVGGRLDLPEARVTGRIRHLDTHELRTSADDARGIEPTELSIDSVTLAWEGRRGQVALRADAGWEMLDFDATRTAGGSVSNDDRDRDRLQAGLRGAIEYTETTDVFLEARWNETRYDSEVDDDGFRRDSDGYELRVGSVIDLGGKTFGEVFVGYRDQGFDDARFGDADGLSFGADLTWNVTGLTTVQVVASRGIEATTLVGASGAEVTRAALDVDHELFRNLILSVSAALVNEDFQDIDRDDDITRAGLAAEYLMNRRLHWRLGWDRDERDISPAGAGGREYTINRWSLQLRGQF